MAEETENPTAGNNQENSSENAVATQNQGENGQVSEGAQQQPQARQSGWGMFKGLLFRMFVIYMISSFFRRSPAPPQQTGSDGKAVAAGPSAASTNLFPKNTTMDMYMYISEDEHFSDFGNPKALFWLEEELVYGDWTSGFSGDGSFQKVLTIPASEAVQNNGSLYLHVYFVKAGRSPNPKDTDTYSRRYTVHKTKRLNRYKKRKFHTASNLLTGETEAHPDLIRKANETTVEIYSAWHPNLTLNLIDDHTPWMKGAVPSPLDDYIEFQPGTNFYYPVIFFNEYWNLNSDYMPVNSTTPVLTLSVTYAPLSLFKWQMYAAQSMRSKWYSVLGEDMVDDDDDQDSLKRTFMETNPYLLGLTIIVSIVHSIFEFLAFKNDIQFWRSRKSLEGLSVRSVFFNVFQSLIVCLYVLDHETNFVIKVSVFIGLAIEIWKIHKVIDVKIDRENKLFGIIPRLKLEDKSTYIASNTKVYDQLAFKYLSWLLFPLLAAYSVYSLLYNEHKGWYSFVLSIMYGFLLTFGFIMMTPQLFINYKMKSVAHLPWRMLTYKALNTFIDDMFAFVIKMPTLYRIGCFRDDIVFFIYLYQRYIYKVDPKRVNEFGTSGDMFDENGDVILPADESGTPQPIEGSSSASPPDEPQKTAEEKKED